MVVGCASPVLVDMVGAQNISAAFSGILAFCGLSSLIGPPVAGELVCICTFNDFLGRCLIILTNFPRLTFGATPACPCCWLPG